MIHLLCIAFFSCSGTAQLPSSSVDVLSPMYIPLFRGTAKAYYYCATEKHFDYVVSLRLSYLMKLEGNYAVHFVLSYCGALVAGYSASALKNIRTIFYVLYLSTYVLLFQKQNWNITSCRVTITHLY